MLGLTLILGNSLMISINIIRSISMPYVSSFERRARQEGFQEGLQEGLQEGQIKLLTRQLQRRFDNLAPDYRTKLLSLPTDTLESLGDALLDFQHLDDLDAWLNSHSGK
jgi:predicted transposase YdaD